MHSRMIPFPWFMIFNLLLTTQQISAQDSPKAGDSPQVSASYWFIGYPSIDATINGEEIVCLISTAMSGHQIDKSRAGLLQGEVLKATTGSVSVVSLSLNGDASHAIEGLSTFPDVTISTTGLQQEHQKFSVGNLSIIAEFLSAAPDAVLGTDIMKSNVMLLRHQHADLQVLWKERESYQSEASFQRFGMKRNANHMPEVDVELPVLGTRGFLPATSFNECLTVTAHLAGILLRSNAAVFGDPSSRRSVDGLKEMETLIVRKITVLGTTFENVPAQVSGLGLNTVGMGLLRFYDLDFDVDGEVIFARLLQPERNRILGNSSPPFCFRFVSPSKVVVEDTGIRSQRLDKLIKPGDELVECDGQVASQLSYWQLTDLLSTKERAWKCRFRNENEIFEVNVQPDAHMTDFKEEAFRSVSSESDVFFESLSE